MLTYFQAIVIGLIQGVTELFPISSLGHSVLLPSLFGWKSVVAAQAQTESYFLAFLVGLHVATALVLVWFYRQQWIAIIKGFFSSLGKRKAETSSERLAWLLIIATIPAGIVGLALEHPLRVLFAKPMSAAIFLIINGIILLYGQKLRNKQASRRQDYSLSTTNHNLAKLTYGNGIFVGLAQTLSLLAGISRSGVTMVSGLLSGLDNQDAARFSFLLATPIILAAGVYKLHDLIGPNGDGVRSQALVGSIAAALAAYVAVRFLDRYFKASNLKPFGYYCIAFGLLMVAIIH